MHWLLQQLLLLAVLLLCADPVPTSGASVATGNVWAIVGLARCNATCVQGSTVSHSEGTHSVNFGCYPANSPSVRRLTGTRIFLAVSTTQQRLRDSECSDSVPPKAPAFVRCIRGTAEGCSSGAASHSWQLDAPSSAAATCQVSQSAPAVTGCAQPGSVALALSCHWHNSATTASEVVDDAQCLTAGLPKPHLPAVPCSQLLGCRPVWKAGAWGACSKHCGLGEMARTVECSLLADTPTVGPSYIPAPGQCTDGEARPHSREYCVVQPECPPYYLLRPGKCHPAFSTTAAQSRRWCNETGLRPSNAECVQLVGDAAAGLNQTRRRPNSDCIGLARPPPFEPCRVDAETLAKRSIPCVEPNATQLTAPPRLLSEPRDNILVQMERLPSMEARCGQSVTLIPGTRLRLHCGVANYKADDLRWRKVGRKRDFRSEEASARDSSGRKCGRICVSQGDLVFRRFKPRDAGTYEVTAGAAKASVHLSWHTAYDAFLRAYLPRAHLLRRLPSASSSSSASASLSGSGADGWAAEQPTMLAREALAWVTGLWSECPCDDGGVGDGGRLRKRTVRCERLRSGTYSVVKDDLCLRQLGKAPLAEDPCRSSCPSWLLGGWDGECPASRCYLSGVSLEFRSVTCRDATGNSTLPDAHCHRTGQLKPEAARQCPNALCQPEWSAGAWSACSVSCGAFGFRSRRVQCLWRVTGQPAGLACEHLVIPRGHQSCYEGPCHLLGCVDLSPVCRVYLASALCAHPSLRRNCCATCNAYRLDVYRSLKKT